MSYYERTYCVGPGETDPFDLCRPSALLLFLQDIATDHAAKIGIGRDELIKHCGAVWILARLWYHLDKPIRGSDTVTIKTWNRGLKGAMSYRDFIISANGEEVGQAVTAWVLADINTHKVKLPTGMKEFSAQSAGSASPLFGKTLPKLTVPDGIKPVCEKTVRYSDLDINVHLNNTKYADLVCDAMGYESMQGRYICDMQINYLKECRTGDRVQLNTAETCENGRFVCGINAQDNKTVVFESGVTLAEL